MGSATGCSGVKPFRRVSRSRLLSAAVTFAWACLLVPTMGAAADLAIQRLSLHQFDDGPLVGSAYEYLPGETGWFTGRITGYQREKRARPDGKGDDERVRLAWNLRILDPTGIPIEAPQSGRIDVSLVAEDKDWVAKFGMNFTVPSFAPRGVYRIPVTVKDEVAGREVAGEITFKVRGDDVPANPSLGMMNFRFLAREDDRVGLQPARYRQGEDVLIRFDIIGYSFGDKNRYSVEYGVEIFGPPKVAESADAEAVDPAGLGPEKPLFSQRPATESQESFYPQRRIPMGFGVKLAPDAPVGTHTLVLTLKDKIGDKTQQYKLPFEVRAAQ